MSWSEAAPARCSPLLLLLALGGCNLRPIYGGAGRAGGRRRTSPRSRSTQLDGRRGQVPAQLPARRAQPAGRRRSRPPTSSTSCCARQSNALAIQLDNTATRYNLIARRHLQPDAHAPTARCSTDSAVRRVVSYNIRSDPFATLIAEQDAERRAAREVGAPDPHHPLALLRGPAGVKLKARRGRRLRRPARPGVATVLLYGPDAGLVARARPAPRGDASSTTCGDPFRVSELGGDELRERPGRLVEEAQALCLAGRAAAGAGARCRRPHQPSPCATSWPCRRRRGSSCSRPAICRGSSSLRKLVEDAATAAALPCYRDEARDLGGVRPLASWPSMASTAEPDALAYLADPSRRRPCASPAPSSPSSPSIWPIAPAARVTSTTPRPWSATARRSASTTRSTRRSSGGAPELERAARPAAGRGRGAGTAASRARGQLPHAAAAPERRSPPARSVEAVGGGGPAADLLAAEGPVRRMLAPLVAGPAGGRAGAAPGGRAAAARAAAARADLLALVPRPYWRQLAAHRPRRRSFAADGRANRR